MDVAEIYEKFDQIGCLTFATIDQNYPQTRIAHLFAYDHEGLYFRTMITKAFYDQLKKTQKVSICGMFPKTFVSHDPLKTLKEKAAVNEMFMLGVKDIEKYPAMTTFCLCRAWGEVFDFDFEMEHRSHKLLRTGFSFGGKTIPFRGVRITEECIACGECRERCSFKAISQHDEQFVIDNTRCDVCGDCYTICPANAVEIVIEDLKNETV